MEPATSERPADPEFLKYSMRSFLGIVEPILRALQPCTICEIGIEQGLFTDFLLEFVSETGCLYTGIDPAPPDAVANPSARFVAGRSLEVLPGLPVQDVYFIDGDHNYYTVSNELKLILAKRPSRSILFLHDVAYPWARRDMYHCPEAIPPGERHPYALGVGPVPGQEAPEPWGLGCKYGKVPFAVALKEGGPCNGVLTAVEDVLRTPEAEGWRLVAVPAVFGLGILYKPDACAPPVLSFLEPLAASVALLGDMLGKIEENRVEMFVAFLRSYQYGQALRLAYDDLEKHSVALGKHAKDLLASYRDLESYTRGVEAENRRLAEGKKAP